EIFAERFAPRNDRAQPVSWDLSAHAGQQGYLEIVDGDDANAFAWLAVGRFSPKVVDLPNWDPHLAKQNKLAIAEMAKSLKKTALEPRLATWVADKKADAGVRVAAAEALMALNPNSNVGLLGGIVRDSDEPRAVREKLAQVLAGVNAPAAREALVESLQLAP